MIASSKLDKSVLLYFNDENVTSTQYYRFSSKIRLIFQMKYAKMLKLYTE